MNSDKICLKKDNKSEKKITKTVIMKKEVKKWKPGTRNQEESGENPEKRNPRRETWKGESEKLNNPESEIQEGESSEGNPAKRIREEASKKS